MFLRISLLLSGVCLLFCNAHVLPEIPNCVFEDTVNLTASKKFANGSYLYEGLLVPPQLTGVYDYIELYDGERKQVKSHVRGCVCQLKNCVKFCCHPRADMYRLSKDSPSLCAVELNEELKYSPYINVTLHNSSRVLMHVLDEFVVQQGIPCEGGYMLMPHISEEDQWELREDGTLYRLADAALLSRRDYCLQSYAVGDTYVLNPMNCPATFDESPTMMLNSIIMLISLPFLYITILIYWFIPELWNLHSKCLICYLLSLAIGTTLIVVVNLQGAEFETVTCAIIGFVAYYFLSAVFYWLNVICYDVWQNFCRSKGNVQHLTQRKQFMYYSLYGWGLPALMTIITIGLQYSNLPLNLKSGIGYSHCWLKTHDWSAMIYFFGPCLLLIIFNIIIFFLTIKMVYKIRNEMNTLAETKDSRRKLRSHKKNIWLFFRLFTVMGIGWLLEIISYMVGNNSDYTIIFQIADVYNAAQGLIIFAILVLNKKVMLLIKKRIMCIKSSNATDSTESQCSEEEIALQSITNGVPQILK